MTEESGARLRQALVDLVAAREAAAQAAARLIDARDVVHTEMGAFGRQLQRDLEPVPLPLLRTLYWDHPEVVVEVIAKSFGLGEKTAVHRLVGPDQRTASCRGGCGATVRRSRVSRTAARKVGPPDRLSEDWRVCESCAERLRAKEAAEDRAREEAWLRASRQHQAEDRARLQRARDEGRPIVRRYVEYDGIPGSWLVDENGF